MLPGLVDSHTHFDFDVLAGLETQQAAVDDADAGDEADAGDDPDAVQAPDGGIVTAGDRHPAD